MEFPANLKDNIQVLLCETKAVESRQQTYVADTGLVEVHFLLTVCVCVWVRACVCACVHACVCVWVCIYPTLFVSFGMSIILPHEG